MRKQWTHCHTMIYEDSSSILRMICQILMKILMDSTLDGFGTTSGNRAFPDFVGPVGFSQDFHRSLSLFTFRATQVFRKDSGFPFSIVKEKTKEKVQNPCPTPTILQHTSHTKFLYNTKIFQIRVHHQFTKLAITQSIIQIEKIFLYHCKEY